jgi:trans-aconitate 2-methyltransferase
MLRQARTRLPDLKFVQADLREWSPPPDADVLYSNAAFQWIPGHLDALTRLFDALRPGAVLAVQMPDNLNEPSHASMREVARSGPWRETLAAAAAARDSLPAVGVYYKRLRPLSRHFEIWHTLYEHPLDGAEGIIEWVKGTGLRPYIDPLPPDHRADFLEAYKERLRTFYPPQYDGKSILRFPRLFFVALRGGTS